MKAARRMSQLPTDSWAEAEYEAFEALETQLAQLVADRRRHLLSSWKYRMRDVGCAARWVRAASAHSLSLKQADGSPAISPAEIGQAVAAEGEPIWEEVPECRFLQDHAELERVAGAFGRRALPYTEPTAWSPDAVRQECRNSAAGPDGLSYSHFAGLPQEHLVLLAKLYDALDRGLAFPSSWHQAKLICVSKTDGGARPITVLQVAYRIWSSRMAKHLADWAD